jgi:hypothetical protein
MSLKSRARRCTDNVLIFHLPSQKLVRLARHLRQYNTLSANWICRDGRAADDIVPTWDIELRVIECVEKLRAEQKLPRFGKQEFFSAVKSKFVARGPVRILRPALPQL